MTFEKTAKAALLYGGRVSVEDARKTHRSALSLMKVFKDLPMLLERFTERHPERWRAVVMTVENLTRFHTQIWEEALSVCYAHVGQREDNTRTFR